MNKDDGLLHVNVQVCLDVYESFLKAVNSLNFSIVQTRSSQLQRSALQKGRGWGGAG